MLAVLLFILDGRPARAHDVLGYCGSREYTCAKLFCLWLTTFDSGVVPVHKEAVQCTCMETRHCPSLSLSHVMKRLPSRHYDGTDTHTLLVLLYFQFRLEIKTQ